MRINFKSELKTWAAYFVVIIVAVFIHELGHCVVAWCHGIKAIPTPAKEYYRGDIPPNLSDAIALGGVMGSVAVSLFAIVFFLSSKFKSKSILLAGALASPGIYSLLFLLKGRGHDSTEFQQAQSAMGASYSGHVVDWMFVSLFIIGGAIWLIRCKPGLRIIPRIIIGVVLSVMFLLALQELNNKIFDPVFSQVLFASPGPMSSQAAIQ